MKTKMISKAMPTASVASFTGTSIKTICVLLLLLFTLKPAITKAQTITGIMTGTGMGVCAGYSFNTTTAATTLAPLNYGNQYYACISANADDISFDPQGNSWRVEISSWEYEYKPTTGTGSLTVTDSNTGNPTTYTFTTSSFLTSADYSTQNGWPSCRFLLNGSYISTAYYRRDNWLITSP